MYLNALRRWLLDDQIQYLSNKTYKVQASTQKVFSSIDKLKVEPL